MNRRELLLGSMALAGAAAVGKAQAASEHDHHHGMQGTPNSRIAEIAADCLQKGEVCLNHCLDLWAQGEKDMAACAKSVNQLLTMCAALQQLANQNSKHLAKQAALTMLACKECEDECKKFEKHESCRVCGEGCRACYMECKKIAA